MTKTQPVSISKPRAGRRRGRLPSLRFAQRPAHGGKTRPGFPVQRLPRQVHLPHGTVMERSHIPLHKWLLAIHLMASSKKGNSAHQLMRNLASAPTARRGFLPSHSRGHGPWRHKPASGPLGGENKIVEVDEAYIGGRRKIAPSTRPNPRKPLSRSLSVTAARAHSTSPT